VLTAALGQSLRLLTIGSVCGMVLGVLATKPLSYIVPDAFVFVPDLPHTSTGKLLKNKLRQDYMQWKWNTERSPVVS
jgi:hypothetical protein